MALYASDSRTSTVECFTNYLVTKVCKSEFIFFARYAVKYWKVCTASSGLMLRRHTGSFARHRRPRAVCQDTASTEHPMRPHFEYVISRLR